ncbi:MAG: hypothetical protein ACU85V_11360 [Gammaproteobacteria bacterium]
MRLRLSMLFSLLLGVAAVAPAGAEGGAAAPDPAYMAALVAAAQDDGRLLPDFYRINPGLDDDTLYAVQHALVARRIEAGDTVLGYKGGFVPRAPVGGVLLAAGRLEDGATVSARDYRRLVVEAEIAFRFCADVDRRLADVAALKGVVCEIAPAMEVADAALADFAAVRADFRHLRQALLPLNVAYRHVMIGAARDAAMFDLGRLAVTTRADNKVIGERSLEDYDELWPKVLWVVNEFVLARGYTVAAGQVIIPGNLTGIHAAGAGGYAIDFGPLGKLELTVAP